MIKSEFGEVAIKGFKGMIMLDLEMVIRALLAKGIFTKEDILEIVDNATKAEAKAKSEAKANAKPDRISPVDLLKGLAAMAEMMEKEMKDE